MSVEPTPKAKAAERPGHAGVAVGAHDELPGQRELLDHRVVADGLGAGGPPSRDLAVELQAVLVGELLLHGLGEAAACSGSPISTCSSGITRSRKVR
jgi:hypothetical protein